jgi:hypothetical protein
MCCAKLSGMFQLAWCGTWCQQQLHITETQTALQACQLVLVSTKVGWLTWAGCNIHLPWHAPVQIAGSYKIVTSHPTSTVGSISRSSGASWLVLWAATSSVFNVMGKVLHCRDTSTGESSIVWNFARFCGPQCTPSWCACLLVHNNHNSMHLINECVSLRHRSVCDRTM